MDRERDLLFGVLAVRLGRLTPRRLADAALTWVASDQADLGATLTAEGELSASDREFVDGMVDQAEALCGTVAKALTELGGPGSVDESFDGSVTWTTEGGPNLSAAATRAAIDPGRLEPVDLRVVAEEPDRYTGERLHDRGGMGRILVVHDEVVGRDIALKEILDDHHTGTARGGIPSGATPPQAARFLREARLTGQLEHPSIVPVYELGRRAHGSLYYTMKLLRGQSLARALEKATSRTAKLALLPHFVDLCQAVAYAHSRGVIHRDIKPANVMIGEFGETVVIDWGLARVHGAEDIHARQLGATVFALDPGEESSAARTLAGQAVGTPHYMPPEQARGEVDAVDARSDVYALGAVLYELLTGQPPFAGGSGLEVLRRVAGDRPTPVRDLAPGTPPELAAICSRAMARDPAARYQSAQGLARDVERFLSGAVVEAYEYSFGEHLRRFVRRHKAPVTTAAVSLVVLTVVLSFSAAWNLRERRRAEREAAKATRVSDFLVDVFSSSDPHYTYGEEVTARELLDRGAAQVADELATEPLVQADIMASMGWAYLNLGLLDSAEVQLEGALQLRSTYSAPEGPELATSYMDLCSLRLDQGRIDQAETLCRRALRMFEGHQPVDHERVASTRNRLASVFIDQGDYEAAEELYSRVLADQEQRHGTDSGEIVTYVNNLANSLGLQGRYEEAEALYRRAAAIQERFGRPNDPGLANTLNNLAISLRLQEKYTEAEVLFQRVARIREEVFGPDHPLLADTLDELATSFVNRGRLGQAEPLAERALAIRRHRLPAGHPELATSINNLANLRLEQGRVADAELLFREALGIWEQAWGADHPNVGIARSNLGAVLTRQGRHTAARQQFELALPVLEKTLGPDHPVLAEMLDEYAALLLATGADARAADLERRAAAIRAGNP